MESTEPREPSFTPPGATNVRAHSRDNQRARIRVSFSAVFAFDLLTGLVDRGRGNSRSRVSGREVASA